MISLNIQYRMTDMEKVCEKKRQERNGALDLIRIIACTGILYLHYRTYLSPDGVLWGDTLITAENSGIDLRCFVEVFFVISGYLIYPHIERIKKKAGVLDFMRPRLWRILPMLVLGTLLYQFLSWRLLATGEAVSYTQSTLWGMISSGLGVQEGWSFINTHINPESWFLDVLLLCYLFFYILVRLGEKTKINCCWGFAFMVLLGASCVSRESELPFLGYMAGRGYEALFGGVLLAIFLKEKNTGKQKYVVSVIILAVYLLYHIFAPWLLVFGKYYLMAFFVAPALIVIAESETAKKCFHWKGYSSFAKITFSTYVLHTCTLLGIRNLTQIIGINVDYSHEALLVAYILIAYFCGTLAYFAVERPLSSRIKRKNAG